MQYLKDFCNMRSEVHIEMVAERIKALREKKNLTQAELARYLGISRSSVNAWEMGISVPSTQYVVELARLFHVSSDYILGIENTATLDVSGLTEDDITLIYQIINHLKKGN